MEDKVLEWIAYFYQTYFREITFSALPRELRSILGDAAYGVITKIVMGTSSKAIPKMAKSLGFLKEGEKADTLDMIKELNEKCHIQLYQETSKYGTIGDIGLIPMEYDKEKGILKFILNKCPVDEVAAAPYVGIVAGISAGLGLKVRPIREPSQKKFVKEGFVVYPVLDKENNKCYIVLEKVG
ncbi:hypothetical protein [Ignicoccus hospitalis]|uniref:Uncharacterized protein n=1 Tax=Ignicoccus hospitalis (strain KIN4/I / DSM 18386 / JCM 14125) TaxID=453591 RepID=A8AC45_IGNH4|nr:hypothetical protein [Ignicoccus hospitalis]ABU82497.1 hypothetical protein Igni_1321 [Ignicoccus hospitalis KIN4/I]HIH90594.1 hypothetical protein [Desulfurococcaceae archaeon]